MKKFTNDQVEEEFGKYTRNVSQNDVYDILEKEDDIIKKATGPLEKFAENIKLLFSIIKDYINGDYKEIPWTVIASIIAALIYIFSPIDLIPDFIPVLGLTDDAAVLALCLKAIGIDLKKYKKWKENIAEYEIIDDNYEQIEDDIDFAMEVEEVFAIKGRGTIVTGLVVGHIELEDEVEIVGNGYNKVTVVTCIEVPNKLLDEANDGDSVGLLLKGIRKDEVKKGDYIIKY